MRSLAFCPRRSYACDRLPAYAESRFVDTRAGGTGYWPPFRGRGRTMSELERGLFDGGLLACSGMELDAVEAALLADRRPFVMPGDRPVWGRDRPVHVEHQRLEFGFDIPRRL